MSEYVKPFLSPLEALSKVYENTETRLDKTETKTKTQTETKTRDKRPPFSKGRKAGGQGMGLLSQAIAEDPRPWKKRRSKRKPSVSSCIKESGICIFTDGACDPNPGPGGWAFVVYSDGVEHFSSSGYAPKTTNNRMEMNAVIAAVKWVMDNSVAEVTIYSDSQYVVRGCNDWRQGWKRKGWKKAGVPMPNADLWQLLDDCLTGRGVILRWVRGHSGIKGNILADELATNAISAKAA